MQTHQGFIEIGVSLKAIEEESERRLNQNPVPEYFPEEEWFMQIENGLIDEIKDRLAKLGPIVTEMDLPEMVCFSVDKQLECATDKTYREISAISENYPELLIAVRIIENDSGGIIVFRNGQLLSEKTMLFDIPTIEKAFSI